MKGKIFYGWYIVIGLFCIAAATAGIAANSFPVTFNRLAETFGFSMTDISFNSTLATLVAMVAAIPVGKLIKKIHIKILMTIAGAIYCVGFLLYATCSTISQFYLCSILVGIGLAGTWVVPIAVLVTNWFEEKRGLAMAIAYTGAGIGGVVGGPLMTLAIQNFGLTATFLIFGIAACILIIPFTLFVVKLHPQDIGLLPYGAKYTDSHSADSDTEVKEKEHELSFKEARKSSAFWLLLLAFFLGGVVVMGVQAHIPSSFENVGYSATFAALIFSVVNAVLIGAKFLFGIVQDKFGTRPCILIFYSINIVALLCLLFARYAWAPYAFMLFGGMMSVLATMSVSLWTADIFGKEDYPFIYSFMNAAATLGFALGITVTGALFDAFKSYAPAWGAYLAITIISGLLALVAYTKKKKFNKRNTNIVAEK